jgi:hypothetical protein
MFMKMKDGGTDLLEKGFLFSVSTKLAAAKLLQSAFIERIFKMLKSERVLKNNSILGEGEAVFNDDEGCGNLPVTPAGGVAAAEVDLARATERVAKMRREIKDMLWGDEKEKRSKSSL